MCVRIINRFHQDFGETMSTPLYQSCIDACITCADACTRCAAACKAEPNHEMLARCMALDKDCAEFCRLAAAFLARDSEFIDLICQDCAEICDACAEECSGHDMEHCQQCAEACRQCAEECLLLGTE